MNGPQYLFQYCQKLIIFSEGWSKVLLAKRAGEADYDGTFTFIGGKMETSDADILTGLGREKDEEIGASALVYVYPHATNNVLFRKKDGNAMIIPHYIAYYKEGDIHLNTDEYSEYRWVALEDLAELEPKVDNIPELVAWALELKPCIPPEQFVEV